ncbi:8-amino-7-oxononanoate synthase [Lysobacter pythonis]|uniref:8-amino-7-oxononanoate synthase n=1 Tax=Solilutibacter pythonis TaxID=2483112 RepID=A0A3M2I0H3_9GAMM|nr:8-amino-7-oxononanoate synthase [Lysobacter pythonis]RMH93885.1 8-amino-7-oxononanoate synthase [Lysobacter pythonis]
MSRPSLRQRVDDARVLRGARQRRRQRLVVERRDGMRFDIGGRWLTAFCGNDYLGLSQHFSVVGALQDEAARSGAGAGGSHLISGHTATHERLEREVADWLQVPAALYFSSGWAANLAVLQSLLEKDDLCVQDRLNHASLIDAARLAGCRLRRYPHGNSEAAQRQLRGDPEVAAMLISDGVFSMDGDIAPLRDLAMVARLQQALLYVDDAHGIGVIGEEGRGSVAAAGLDHQQVPLQMVTLSKALGGVGAVVAGDAGLIGHLAETARPYVYTTALPPAMAAATLAAIKLARREHWRRERLGSLISSFRDAARHHGFRLLDSDTPIQPLLCDSDAEALAMAGALRELGYLVVAILPPTVPQNGARLRITLSTLHAPEDVDGLVRALLRARDETTRRLGGAA